MSGICSAHSSDVTDPDCVACKSTPADLLGKERYAAMKAEAEAAGTHTCATCGFVFYKTTMLCPACSSTATDLHDLPDVPDVIARQPLRRCAITGNPCGTDTWHEHHPCMCDSCQSFLRERGLCTRCAEPFRRGVCHCSLPVANILASLGTGR